MMTVRKLDAITGEIVTSGVQFINGRDEVAQNIKTRLRLFLGEYFRNIQDGTPWFQSILGKEGTLSSKDASIKKRIFETPGVVEIISFSSNYDLALRIYDIQSQVITTYGLVDFSVNGTI